MIFVFSNEPEESDEHQQHRRLVVMTNLFPPIVVPLFESSKVCGKLCTVVLHICYYCWLNVAHNRNIVITAVTRIRSESIISAVMEIRAVSRI